MSGGNDLFIEEAINNVSDHDEDILIEEESEALTPELALTRILRGASVIDGLECGLRVVLKKIDRLQAKMCFLVDSCDEKRYTSTVMALCKQNNVPLIKISDKKKLGELCGLCKYDVTGEAKNIVGCSSAVITNYRPVDQPCFDLLVESAVSIE